MDSKKNTELNFDRKAENFEETHEGKVCLAMYKYILKEVTKKPFKKVLDVGCGNGNLLEMILGRFNGVDVWGIDLSFTMIEKAREKLGKKAKLLQGDAEDLPFEDNSFDLLICNSSFHHYVHPEKVLSEFGRVLKQNSCLIIADPWTPNLVRFIINVYFKLPFNKKGDVKFYSEEEMQSILLNKGFMHVRTRIINEEFILTTAETF